MTHAIIMQSVRLDYIFITISYRFRTECRVPRFGLHLDGGSEHLVGNQIAQDLVEDAFEITWFVYGRRLDRCGQYRYSHRQVLQTDVGRRVVLFQGLVVWGKPPRKRSRLCVFFFFFCNRITF